MDTRFPSKIQRKKDEKKSNQTCDFEETILDYIRRLGLPLISEKLKLFDYSSAKVFLITSVPGYHTDNKEKYAHLKLKKLLSLYSSPSSSHSLLLNQVFFPFCLFCF